MFLLARTTEDGVSVSDELAVGTGETAEGELAFTLSHDTTPLIQDHDVEAEVIGSGNPVFCSGIDHEGIGNNVVFGTIPDMPDVVKPSPYLEEKGT